MKRVSLMLVVSEWQAWLEGLPAITVIHSVFKIRIVMSGEPKCASGSFVFDRRRYHWCSRLQTDDLAIDLLNGQHALFTIRLPIDVVQSAARFNCADIWVTNYKFTLTLEVFHELCLLRGSEHQFTVLCNALSCTFLEYGFTDAALHLTRYLEGAMRQRHDTLSHD